MAIPDFQSIMLPLLQFAADGNEHTVGEAREHLAKHFKLTDAELAQLLPSGRARLFLNRVAWAKFYLQQAGLLDSPRRGSLVISDTGTTVVRKPPSRIDLRYLERFPKFVAFRRQKSAATDQPPIQKAEDASTPEERLEDAYQQLRDQLAASLLDQIKDCSPAFFEKLVVELLLKMGYGGSLHEAGEAVGRGGDEGIDGVIKEDRLGLDVIYLQAKRWTGTVGRPEIQKFVGALHGKRAKKGVFITTGSFSADAKNYVATIDPRISLVDGGQLAQLMIEYGLGVTSAQTYQLKRIDLDYFEEA